MQRMSRLQRSASDSHTISPPTPYSPTLSSTPGTPTPATSSSKPSALASSPTKPSALSPSPPRLPSTRGIPSLHPPHPLTPPSSSDPAFRRQFLSPMDRLFIFFFEPHTLHTGAWANLPSPTQSPTPSPSASPFQHATSSPPPSPTHPFLPLIGYSLLSLLTLLLRTLMSHHSHSGQATPPMYGDYEAQRHWMELTIHLPAVEWYTYDLQWWGLDYPPLTAYVSWLCGQWMRWVEPGQVAFVTSRGYETESGKMWMRLTVLLADCVTFLPSLFLFTRLAYAHTKTTTAQALMLLIVAIHPAFILIDHGHFQYNCVVLGLTVYAVVALFTDKDLTATFLFCLALGFKQMALYFAPVFFVLLLSRAWFAAWQRTQGSFVQALGPFMRRVAELGAVVLATFALLLLPWLLSANPVGHVQQILHRLFPVARGLYEDKVANWYHPLPHAHTRTTLSLPLPLSTPLMACCVSAVVSGGARLRCCSSGRSCSPPRCWCGCRSPAHCWASYRRCCTCSSSPRR